MNASSTPICFERIFMKIEFEDSIRRLSILCRLPDIKIAWINPWVKVPKWAKMSKNSLCHTPYLRKHRSYDCDFWYTCVKWCHPQVLFSFFQNFSFLGCWRGEGGGEGGQKIAQNDIKFCLCHKFIHVLCSVFQI